MTPTEHKNELIKDLKDTLKIGIGAITVGGIVKEDWLQNNYLTDKKQLKGNKNI